MYCDDGREAGVWAERRATVSLWFQIEGSRVARRAIFSLLLATRFELGQRRVIETSTVEIAGMSFTVLLTGIVTYSVLRNSGTQQTLLIFRQSCGGHWHPRQSVGAPSPLSHWLRGVHGHELWHRLHRGVHLEGGWRKRARRYVRCLRSSSFTFASPSEWGLRWVELFSFEAHLSLLRRSESLFGSRSGSGREPKDSEVLFWRGVEFSKVRVPPQLLWRKSGLWPWTLVSLGLEEHVSVVTPFPLGLPLWQQHAAASTYDFWVVVARSFVLAGAVVKDNFMLPVESADALTAEATLALDGSSQSTADEILVISLDSAPLLFRSSPYVSMMFSLDLL